MEPSHSIKAGHFSTAQQLLAPHEGFCSKELALLLPVNVDAQVS
jgi:hypothetical protein